MSNEKTKRAVIYCRVSTKEQVEEGNSLVTQEKLCRDFASKNQFDIAAVFIEMGESAKTADRPELKRMIGYCAIKKHSINVVIAYKIDRISRNTDDYSQIRLLLKKYGVEIKSTSEHFEDTPAGRFMENIIANVAQFDNDVRAERCSGGMKDAMREGRYVWAAPFGYSNVRVDGKATIEKNDKAVVVKELFKMLQQNNAPVESIRKAMAERGLCTKNGRPLAKSYFYRLIKNEVYAGWIVKFGERHKGKFEPIITEELFREVAAVLESKKRKPMARLVENPDFPLRRFIRHSSGKQLTGYWAQGKHKKYPYYMAHGTGINIRKEILEATFKEWLDSFKLDIEKFDVLLQNLKKYIKDGSIDVTQEKAQIEQQISTLKSQRGIVLQKNIDGVIDDVLCRETILELNCKIVTLQESLQELQNYKAPDKDIVTLIRNIILKPSVVWEQADYESRLRLQWFYFPEGIILDKTGSRTPKICSIFKLNQTILRGVSSNVDFRFSKSNTNIWQLSLPVQNEGIVDESLLQEVLSEATLLKARLDQVHRDQDHPFSAAA
ncbi:MAG: recombinase family protein [Ferruginibacter sp.]